MKKFIQYFREKFIVAYMIVLGLLIVISSLLSWSNKQELVRTVIIKTQAEEVKYIMGGIFERTLRAIDLGIRGYALTQDAQLLNPYDNAIRQHPVNMKRLDSLFALQNLDSSIVAFSLVKLELDNYLDVAERMKTEITNGNQDEFLRLLKMDKGYDAWQVFSPFNNSINAFEDKLIAQAEADYQNAIARNLIVQAVLLVFGITILFAIAARLRKQTRQRLEIFNTLKDNSLQFLFHPGKIDDKIDQSSIINETIAHFKTASSFISSISQGNYNVNWEGLDETNIELNKQTLAGHLHAMREQLIKIRSDEEKRNWTNLGLTQYSEVVRKYQNDTEALCFESVKYITKYLGAQQGGLFVLVVEDGKQFLELTASYAFERKKFLEKRIQVGFGLIGQTFLEGETIKLKKLPQGYTLITSGLGDATPGSLVIVPMKHNEQTVAILELAAFTEFTSDHVTFLEKCGEFLAAALMNAQTNDQIKKLLQDTQMQAENMKSQEEEMRQNMEELSATQEEMLRKEREYISKIEKLEKQSLIKIEIDH